MHQLINKLLIRPIYLSLGTGLNFNGINTRDYLLNIYIPKFTNTKTKRKKNNFECTLRGIHFIK